MKFKHLNPGDKFLLQDTDLGIYSGISPYIKLSVRLKDEKGKIASAITSCDGHPFYGITDDTDVVKVLA